MRTVGDPETEAQQLLDAVWRYLSLPVDPIYIAQRLGIKVFTAGLSDGVASLIRNRPGYDPEIYLNAVDSYNRQRWNAGRELGHYIHRLPDIQAVWEYVSGRHSLTTSGNTAESYANAFAGYLLMPSSELKLGRSRARSLLTLANAFRVPVEVMRFRLTALAPSPTPCIAPCAGGALATARP
jgi:Zn-dependent peptidase ImmA (M78 family)